MADRIEKEIEEILKKIDNFVPEGAKRRAPKAGHSISSSQNWLLRRLARISLNQVMMWSLFVVIVAFFARSVPAATWIMVGALIVFATAFLLSRAGGSRRPSVEKRWRGEPMDLSGPTWPERFKAWWQSRRRA
jgi:hypothetical protein